jgi:Tol biopolymer transport system component
VAIPNVSGRSPAWSPVEDAIAYFTSTPEGLRLRFAGSGGEARLGGLELPTGAVTSIAFWSGRSLAIGVSPGSGAAEIVLVDLPGGQARRVLRAGPFTMLRGLAWAPDDAQLVYGVVQHQSRVLLIEGLGL